MHDQHNTKTPPLEELVLSTTRKIKLLKLFVLNLYSDHLLSIQNF